MDYTKMNESIVKEGMSKLNIKEGLSRLKLHDLPVKMKKPLLIKKPEAKAPPVQVKQPVPGLVPARPPVSTGPVHNPFDELPFPNPGERIKADHFRALSQALTIIRDVFSLSSSLFGQTFGMVKLALTTQQYTIQRVMTVFGNEIDNLEDDSLDNRKVVQIVPVELGERNIMVVLAEAVETRRFTPNLLGMSHSQASEKLRSVLGDVTFPKGKFTMMDVTDSSLKEAKEEIY